MYNDLTSLCVCPSLTFRPWSLCRLLRFLVWKLRMVLGMEAGFQAGLNTSGRGTVYSPLNAGIQEWVFKCIFSLFKGNE